MRRFLPYLFLIVPGAAIVGTSAYVLLEERAWVARAERAALEDWIGRLDRRSAWRGRRFDNDRIRELFKKAQGDLREPGATCLLTYDEDHAILFHRAKRWDRDREDYEVVVPFDIMRTSAPEIGGGEVDELAARAAIEFHLGQYEMNSRAWKGDDAFGLRCNGIARRDDGTWVGDFGTHVVAGPGVIIILDRSGRLKEVKKVFTSE